MQLTSTRGSILHLHSNFLPKTELWIPRLLAEVKAYEHISCAGRYCLDGHKDVGHHKFVRHRLGKVMDQRFSTKRWLRALALLRLKLTKGEAGAVFSTLKAENINPVLLHAHFGDVGYTYLLLAKRLKVPYVVSFYGWDYLKLPRQQPAYYKYYRELFTCASALIAEGPAAAETLQKLGADHEKIRIINLGTTIPEVEKSRALEKNSVLLQVASLTEKKGQLVTIQAFELIAEQFPEATLLLVGDNRDPDYAQKVDRAIKASLFADRIEHRGFVPLNHLASVFSTVAVFVQPSQTASDGDSEGGAPVALLDAQAYGLPVAVSDHCDLPFVAADLGWNTPVPAGDAMALSLVLAKALSRNLVEQIRDAETVRRFVSAKFSVTSWGNELQKLYDELLTC